MLLRFTVENFASIRSEQELSMVALDLRDDIALLDIPLRSEKALPAVSIYGPNASGKSNLLAAIEFMSNAVVRSHQKWDPKGGVPRRPFLLDHASRNKPTRLIVEFVVKGVRYEYGFSCDSEEILEEWLHSFPHGKSRKLFTRNKEGGVTFGSTITSRRTLELIKELVRPNSLFLSTAAANNAFEVRDVYDWFAVKLRIATDANRARWEQFTLHVASEHQKEQTLNFLKHADFAIADVRAKERELDDEFASRLASVMRALDVDFNKEKFSLPPDIEIIHDTPNGLMPLPLEVESSGTKTWLALAGVVVQALKRGHTLVVDELDARLHPVMAAALVQLFQDPTSNKNGAQLLFNTHDVTLLGPIGLTRMRRDQVWFAERDKDLSTHIFPLTEYRIRDGLDNVERGYLNGRYGALPFIDDKFASVALGGGGEDDE